MNSIKYVGLDVHRDTISVAVLNAEGKLVMQSVIATHATAILDFLHGLRGTLHVTFEEGTHSGWLYDLLVRRVAYLVVCNPRKNALLKAGSKSDAIDARKLAELLRLGYCQAGVSRTEQHGGGEASGAQLCGADGRHHAHDGAVEGAVSQPGDCLCRQQRFSERGIGKSGWRSCATAGCSGGRGGCTRSSMCCSSCGARRVRI